MPVLTSLAQAAARGGASTVVFQLVRMVIGFGATIVSARLLAPDDFGLFAIVLVLVGFTEIFRDFGFLNAAAQAATLSRAQQSNLFWLNLLLGGLLAAVLLLGAHSLADFFNDDRLQPLVQALAIVFVINGASVQFKATLVRSLRIVPINIAETVSQLLGAVTVVVMAALGFGYWALYFQQLTNACIALILIGILSRWWPGLPARADMKGLLKYGAALSAQQALNYLVRNIDNAAIGKVLGPQQLGYYDRAYYFLMIPIGQLNAPLTRVAVPTLARLWNSGTDFERYLHAAQRVAAFVTVPIFALIVGLAEPAVVVLLGEQWAFTGQILQVLAVGGIFRSLMQITYWAYLSSGKMGTMLRFDLCALPLLAAIILAGLQFGVLGVAVGHSVGYALYWLAGLWWMTRQLGLHLSPFLRTAWRSIALLAVPMILIGLAVTSLIEVPLLALPIGAILSIAGAASMVGLAPSVRKDYREVVRIARLSFKAKRK